nr:hypothetical protein [Tanacetum cinerariifolium]
MDEIDQKNKAAKNPKRPFDTDAEPYNQTQSMDGDSDSELRFMPDDDLVSLTGFETPNSADDDFKEGAGETFNAFADMPARKKEGPQKDEGGFDKLASIQSTMATISQRVQDLRSMYKDMVFLLEAAEVFKKAKDEGERWEKNNPETPTEENPDQP